METKFDDNKRNPFARKLSFPLGALYVTPGAERGLLPDDILKAITRHARGDWGEVDDADWKENDFSVKNGYRILSAYATEAGTRFWVITEADRSATTVLLPEEY